MRVLSEAEFGDIQGTILQGYRVDYARHFVLRVTEPVEARAFLGSLVDSSPGVPKITTAARWTEKPSAFLNIGVTFTGLQRLGVPEESLETFPEPFRLGATHPVTKDRVGDVGNSDSEHWIGGLHDGNAVHVILSLWVHKSLDVRDEETTKLRLGFGGGLEELADPLDTATLLPDRNVVHFGYRDSISQPLLEGAPAPKRHKAETKYIRPVPIGAVLLGYPGPLGAVESVQPEQLSTNSSFAAFRVLEQDVAGFEGFLTQYSERHGIDRELLAAKVCGRWRNGTPLVLSPDTDEPPRALEGDEFNDFDYLDSDVSDPLGDRCPIGSHIRRTHPRSERVTGTKGNGHLHRIVRRGMPYGTSYNPDAPDDEKRGLIGYFINANLRYQFEFVMSDWVNRSTYVQSHPHPDGSDPHNRISGQDVLCGVNDPRSSSFHLPGPRGISQSSPDQTLTGFSPFVTTRGGAYCYLPSITALRYLATLAT